MAAFFHCRGVLCSISEWRRFFIAGVFSAIYLSEILFIFLIAGVFSAIYPSGGVFSLQGCSLFYIRVAAFFHSRGGLCYISEWRRFLIAVVFFAIYPSSGFFDSRGVLCYISE